MGDMIYLFGIYGLMFSFFIAWTFAMETMIAKNIT